MSGARLPAHLLERHPEEAARLIALRYLHEADAAWRRVGDPEDGEALHDFRVAVRRLRSACRAYRPHLASSVSRKLRRRLRSITETTNPGRDAEVLLGWVRELAGPDAGREGVDRLVRRLEERRAASRQDALGQIADEWKRLSPRARRRLSEYATTIHLDGRARHATFGRVAGELVLGHVADLRARLADISGPDASPDIHRARISAKRLRYLLEPLGRRGKTVREFVYRLKALQDLFGDIRDMQVLSQEITGAVEEAAAGRARRLHRLALEAGGQADRPAGEEGDESAGLVRLARAARERLDGRFAEAAAEWAGGRAEPFLGRLEAWGGGLAAGPQRAPVEIERKYLLSAVPERAREAPPVEVVQGWLPGIELHERIRRARGRNGDRFTRTFKFGTGVRRIEIEEDTTPELFESLWPLTHGRRVEKRRYAVRDGSLVWEVDEFADRDLVLAEVELPSDRTAVELPGWLRSCVVREVTGEPEYVNLNLAT